jgi:hypothetical protein
LPASHAVALPVMVGTGEVFCPEGGTLGWSSFEVSNGGGAAAGGVTVGQGKKTWALQQFCGSART